MIRTPSLRSAASVVASAPALLAANRGEIVRGRAPDTLDIRRYFPTGVGDTWQYTNLVKDGLSPISILVPLQLARNALHAAVVAR